MARSDALAAAVAVASQSERWRRARRLLVSDRTALAGLALVALVVLAAVGAEWLAPAPPDAVDFASRLAPPSAAHPLGTDNLGRDLLSRLLFGARLSLAMTIVTTAGITVLGIAAGILSGYHGGAADIIVMRVVDVLLSLPRLILALALTGILGVGLLNLMIAIVAVGWADYSRVVRSMVLSLRERPFVESARAVGASSGRIMARHIAPNLIGPVIVLSTLDLGAILLSLSGLSFLGLGVRPPTPEWGSMLAEGKNFMDRAPQLMAYPGIAIALLVLGFNLLGDGLRDILDPRVREPGH